MSAVVRVLGERVTARVSGGVWTSEDPAVADLLSATMQLPENREALSYSPDVDAAMAYIAVNAFGGVIVETEDPETRSKPDRVY